VNIEKWINLDTERVNDLCCDFYFGLGMCMCEKTGAVNRGDK